MLGIGIGLAIFLPTAVWLLAVMGLARWHVSVIFLLLALGLHLIAYQLQMHFVSTRAPHLVKGSYLREDAVDVIPKWTTQFTGAAFSAFLTIALVWVLRFL